MLRLVLILISSFILSASSALPKKPPVVVYSNRLMIDRLMDVITYEGAVRMEFENYDLITDKMLINLYKDGEKTVLYSIEFPNQTKIANKKASETVSAPNAVFDGKTGIIKCEGEIFVEKSGMLFTTTFVEIELGIPQKMEHLLW